jgi:hypothetical protein
MNDAKRPPRTHIRKIPNFQASKLARKFPQIFLSSYA